MWGSAALEEKVCPGMGVEVVGGSRVMDRGYVGCKTESAVAAEPEIGVEPAEAGAAGAGAAGKKEENGKRRATWNLKMARSL